MDTVPNTRQTQNYPWPLATNLACAMAADTVLDYYAYTRHLEEIDTHPHPWLSRTNDEVYHIDDTTAEKL